MGVVETVVVVDDVVDATVDSSVDSSVLDGGEVDTVEERMVGTGVVVPVKHSRQKKQRIIKKLGMSSQALIIYLIILPGNLKLSPTKH